MNGGIANMAKNEYENFGEWFEDNCPPILKIPLYVIAIPFVLLFLCVGWLFLPPRLAREWLGINSNRDYDSRGG
jgi:hypothetical protein